MNSTGIPAALNLPIGTQERRGLSWVATVDHKRIGILYLLTTFAFFLIGGVEALVMRLQLSAPHNNLLSPDVYNQLFTLHRTTLIFLVGMPPLVGLENFFRPH